VARWPGGRVAELTLGLQTEEANMCDGKVGHHLTREPVNVRKVSDCVHVPFALETQRRQKSGCISSQRTAEGGNLSDLMKPKMTV